MKFTSLRRALALAGMLSLAAIFSAPQAAAISISVSTATLGGNTATNVDNSPPRAENRSAVSDPDIGGSALETLGATVDGLGRYTAMNAADSDAANFASITRNATHNFRVTVTVTPDDLVGTVYDLKLDVSRLGALVVRDEGGAAGVADISAMSATINAVAEAGLSLADIAGLNTNSTTVTNINQAGTVTLSGLTGAQVFNVDFSFTTQTSSGNNVVSGGDEGAVMLGLAGTTGINAADDYPGTSNRPNGLAQDGVWLAATATVVAVVPEPSTFVMGGMGLLGAMVVAVRRRRAA